MIEIYRPKWNGGDIYFGLATYRVKNERHTVAVKCTYIHKKDGLPMFPDIMYAPKWLVMRQPTQQVGHSGTFVYLCPKSIFEVRTNKTAITVKDNESS